VRIDRNLVCLNFTNTLDSFGIPATLLEMVPIAGIFFAFTNTCGAALWAADLESTGTTAPGLKEQAKKAE
jgi:hypothetical protein